MSDEHQRFLDGLSLDERELLAAQHRLDAAAAHRDEALCEYYLAWGELARVRARFDTPVKLEIT